MRPAIWTSYFIEFDPEEAARTFASEGWRELELSTEHAEALLGRGRPQQIGADFRCFAADHGVTFPQAHLWLTCDIAGPDHQQTVEDLKRWLDLFLALEVRAAVLHPGGQALLSLGREPQAVFDLRVRALRALSEHVQDSDLVLCLENVEPAPFADDLLAIIEATGGNRLGICLDTGHLHLVDGNQKAFIEQAGRHLKALHIADNDGSSDQHLLPHGRGTVNWADVVPPLRELKYDGLFDLEIPGENRCPVPVRLAKLRYAKELLSIMLSATAS